MEVSAITRTLIVLLMMSCAKTLIAEKMTMDSGYWPSFVKPEIIHVTPDWNTFQSLAPGKDPGGVFGSLHFTIASVAGLAAKATNEGKISEMVWVLDKASPNYTAWLDSVIRHTKARLEHTSDTLDLVRHFAREGVIRGYILYRADSSKRSVYDAATTSSGPWDESVNVATSLAGLYDAIIVEEAAESVFRGLGLRRLLDVRGRDDAWLFEHYGSRLSRSMIHVIDPKAPHMRDHCIAAGSMMIFGADADTERVFRWLEPNSPVYGWNAGGEDTMTNQITDNAMFHTASNWIVNLPVMATVRAGADAPWEQLLPNRGSSFDPIRMQWQEDRHFTSFITTDGDNIQWALGGFFFSDGGSYWDNPNRGRFPIGWTAPVCGLSMSAVPALEYLAATATEFDNIVSFSDGYIYPENYGRHRNADPVKLLEKRAEQFAGRFDRLGIRCLCLLAMDWDTTEALRACEIFARKIPNLAGIFAMQYYPYNAGLGKILWVRNSEGDPIPVISARYALWGQLSKVENNGPPALVAKMINESEHKGPPTGDAYFDWTSVHVWSWFKKAGTSKNILAEEVDQSSASIATGCERGIGPLAWCVDRLSPYVKVVTPEELCWRARLHMKPRETLGALARKIGADMSLPDIIRSKASDYGKWVVNADLSQPRQVREALMKLKALRFGLAGAAAGE
ncbi:MAG: GxGYxYP family putative glycoside hydrolase [Candidatus Sumerlaeota bacterium]|nr:GxGYxYP family putative glycoside hydrolase [Candidatus Sumerlaeota bacterium]